MLSPISLKPFQSSQVDKTLVVVLFDVVVIAFALITGSCVALEDVMAVDGIMVDGSATAGSLLE